MSPIEVFLDRLQELPGPVKILELGTKRWDPERPTHQRQLFIEQRRDITHVRSDFLDGEDVDVIADVHTLSSTFGIAQFDAIFAASVLEHLARPWIAAVEMNRVLKPNGIAYIATHQTFPIHGYPNDYFRFTTSAMKELFHEDVGWEMLAVGYTYPCVIAPLEHVAIWDPTAPSYLNISTCVLKKNDQSDQYSWPLPVAGAHQSGSGTQ